SDEAYQELRDAAAAVIRAVGVETGGSNVQFAVNPKDGRLVIIEMNPRVSRSSALASKATGFPIAKVAAKLAVGYTLDEIANDITGGATPASFEPTIDYVVTKIPRFAFEKFPGASPVLTTSMKSVGEAMAIGRTFQESLQKALRSLETGLTGLDEVAIEGYDAAKGIDDTDNKNHIRAALGTPTPERLLKVAQAMRLGASDDLIHNACRIDPWFVAEIRGIVDAEAEIKAKGLPDKAAPLRRLKALGFSDRRLGKLTGTDAETVTQKRRSLGVRPVFKRIDTCAAEFASPTAYMYSTYEAPFAGEVANEAAPSAKKKVIILGGGPNRIGQGIEFDYCCVHAAFALRELGFETIMVNSNPETVSTDYDTSDKLYFEPLTLEDVLNIYDQEQPEGVFVQFGGQTPLNLAAGLKAAGVPILGTPPESIEMAEDRQLFAAMLDKLGLRQTPSGSAVSTDDAVAIAKKIGYPVLVRPSFVLGGRAMELVYNEEDLRRYMASAIEVTPDRPVLVDRFLEDAIEVDVDCICDGELTVIGAIMEHIEEAGIHSGDSACVIPTFSLSDKVLAEISAGTKAMAHELNVRGLMNVQFAIKGEDVYVLEVNPRASRTVPFVSKTIGVPLAKLAAKVMTGKTLRELGFTKQIVPEHFSVKEAVFPFLRYQGIDIALGPEMKSTGEVMGIDVDLGLAYAKSQMAAPPALPRKGNVFISVKDADKEAIISVAREFVKLGFGIIATSGTADALAKAKIKVKKVFKLREGRPNVLDRVKNGDINFIINTPSGKIPREDEVRIRNAALAQKIPIMTTVRAALASANGIRSLQKSKLRVRSLQEYHAETTV
ncbi:MAG TPA: carbamoyl-phosphate synthase large subunit, partial [Chthoniobacterales bacterium]